MAFSPFVNQPGMPTNQAKTVFSFYLAGGKRPFTNLPNQMEDSTKKAPVQLRSFHASHLYRIHHKHQSKKDTTHPDIAIPLYSQL